METPYMNTYVAQEATRLLNERKSYRAITLSDAKRWLKENENWENRWLGFPEGELACAYHSDKKMVCRFIVWLHEAPAEDLRSIYRSLLGIGSYMA